jgi:hypothetical protein
VVPPTSGSINTEALSPRRRSSWGAARTRRAERGWTQGNYTDWAFMGAWVFLDEIVPRAASLSVDDLMAAAAEVQVDALDSITGFGFEFIPAGEPNSGQNLRAIPVVQQWQEGRSGRLPRGTGRERVHRTCRCRPGASAPSASPTD